jgi:1-deoxy-D-xylulose-5-phosphate reductoisomerase
MKKIVIFGSTGSIGKSALDVVRKNREEFKVIGLCANSDSKTLEQQVKEFAPDHVCLRDEAAAKDFGPRVNKKAKFFIGEQGLDDFCRIDCDISLMAISGLACLRPLVNNLGHAKRVALASKEAIVTAGSFVFKQAKKSRTQIIPVDSEINALFQLLGGKDEKASKVYLTASGGALFNHGASALRKVTVGEVLNHPTWSMGKRITVDSATLVNKAFEVVETHYFFNVPYKDIEVVIHRESLIHAMAEYADGSLLACLYPTDMRIPIAYAMHYPKRRAYLEGVGFKKPFNLTFRPMDEKRFPLFGLMLEAAKRSDNALTVMNAADETAVDYFVKGKIKFLNIHKALNWVFEHHPAKNISSMDDVFFWDKWAREKTKEYLDRI